MDCCIPGFSVLHYFLEFAQTHDHWIDDAIQPSHPLPSPSPPVLSLSQHQGFFQWVGSLHQVAKVSGLQLQHQSFQWIFRVDFFYIDWFDLVVQRTLKNLLQHHSMKALILRCSAYFMVQFSHPYMTTGKTIALTRRTFACKIMSLLFNTLSRFIIAFLSKSKHLLISWLQSWTSVTLSITNLIKGIRKKKSLDPGSLCHFVIIYLNISYKHRKSPHSLKSLPFLQNSQWKQNLIAIEYLSGS